TLKSAPASKFTSVEFATHVQALYDEKKYTQVVQLIEVQLRRCIKHEDTRNICMLLLARCYLNGYGVASIDYQRVLKYAYPAAHAGNAEAQNLVGWCYLEGRGVEPCGD